MRSLLWVSVLSAALAGCVADAGVGVRATYVVPPPPPPVAVTVTADAGPPPDYQASAQVDDAYVEPAAMVYVNPDVQVIEDYDYPVFFVGGLYWRNDGGVWYSSSWHDRGWGESRDVPVSVRGISRPEGYVHYHANVNARVGEPGYRNTHVEVRHPSAPPPQRFQPGHAPPPRSGSPNYGHGPVENHPTQQAHPAEPMHPAEGYQGKAPTQQAHPAEPMHPAEGYQGKAPTQQEHPAEPPRQGYGQAPTQQAHPAEPAKPAGGYGQAPMQQAHPAAPAKPAPYKAPPPAKKKK